MRFIISIFIFSILFSFNNNLFAQSDSYIRMTPAEYQNLMETILQAKKRRMVKHRYYQHHQAAQQYSQANSRNQISNKIQELESVYAQIAEQQQKDNSNKVELEKVKEKLAEEMRMLTMQLSDEKAKNEQLNNKFQENTVQQSQNIADENRLLTTRMNELELERQRDKIAFQNEIKILKNQLKKQDQTTTSTVSPNTNTEKQIAVLSLKIQELEKEKEQKNSQAGKATGNQLMDYQNLQSEIQSLKKQLNNTASKNNSDHSEALKDLNKKINALEKQQSTLLTSMQKQGSNGEQSAIVDAALLTAMNKQLAEMEVKLEAMEASQKSTPAPTSDQTSMIKSLEQKIVQLEKKVRQQNNKPVVDHTQTLKSLQDQLQRMERELDGHSHAPAPIIVNTPAPAPPKEDVKTFVTSRRQQNVFFLNGSANLTEQERGKIRQISNWLTTYEQLDITIKGFASNVGSLATNERLSQQRAETVRQELLNMGVRANRIILQPLGIDTTSTDPANARRAEIHLLIRE